MIPKRVGRYQVIEEIARGGMATVLHARDPRFNRDVALKLLPRPFVNEAQFRARFQREARTIASLEHDAIVPVYDSGEQDGQPYLVMRHMAGGSLAEQIARGPMRLAEAASVLARVGSALDHAHARGVIHRDLKPGNVLFDPAGLAFLSDFGIAQISEATISLTISGAIIGTPAYMSPEQVQGDVELDARSDIYALGIILFEMLTGQQPYQANTPTKVMMKHVLEPVPHIRELDPGLSATIDDVVARAMAKERSGRFATAGQLAKAYLELLEGPARPVSVPAPVRPLTRPRPSTTLAAGAIGERLRWSPRPLARRWVAGSVLGLVGVAALIGGVFASRGLDHTTPTAPPSSAPVAALVTEPSHTPSPTPTTSPSTTPRPPTATPAPVLLTIQTDAVCRRGPGVNYDVVGYLTSGQIVEGRGRNVDGTWWWIEFPSGDRSCWVSGVLVVLRGAGEALPVLTPGPTSTPGPTATLAPPPGEPKPAGKTPTEGVTKIVKTFPPKPYITPY